MKRIFPDGPLTSSQKNRRHYEKHRDLEELSIKPLLSYPVSIIAMPKINLLFVVLMVLSVSL